MTITERINAIDGRYIRLFIIVMAAVVSGIAIYTMPIRDHDTSWFRGYMLEYYRGEYQYFTGDLGSEPHDGIPTMFNIPHVVFMLPFVLGMHWASFWCAFSIMMVLTGDQTKLFPALTRLIFIATPYVFLAFSVANVIAATAFGLLILLQRKKGYLRGLGWALLMLRPQDSLPWLIFDGLMALRERDWKPFVAAGVIVLLPILHPNYGFSFYSDWLIALLNYSSTETRQEFALVNFGLVYSPWLAALVGFAIGAVRFIGWKDGKPRWRGWQEMSRTEQLWVMLAVWYIAQPYGTYTMLWLIIFAVREFMPARALLAYVLLFPVSLYGFTVVDPVRAVWGVVLSIFVMALLIPRQHPPLEPPTQPANPVPS